MTINDKLDALALALSTALPTRIVTREWRDPSLRKPAQLTAGVLTVIAQSGSDYANYPGRNADLGTLEMVWVASLQVSQSGTGLDVEQAELALVAEVEGFLRALPAGLGDIVLTGWSQSGQTETPYGWVLFRLSWPFL